METNNYRCVPVRAEVELWDSGVQLISTHGAAEDGTQVSPGPTVQGAPWLCPAAIGLHPSELPSLSFACLSPRMFPAMRVKIVGLDPHQQYYIAMDIVPVDNKRYRCAFRTSPRPCERHMGPSLFF
ncbi:hypothetical protein Z043_124306 [Scleropages formosus]|uniref:T-box domain-containing protein n=1 Tax=Scleropages formosus TaxID=113540 RepID=A0A0P7TA60_SCLFO|nr:hypothetical protein Z043_124306 [Scleropages formosus]